MHGVFQQVHCGAQPQTIPEISVQPAKMTLTSEVRSQVRALWKSGSATPGQLCKTLLINSAMFKQFGSGVLTEKYSWAQSLGSVASEGPGYVGTTLTSFQGKFRDKLVFETMPARQQPHKGLTHDNWSPSCVLWQETSEAHPLTWLQLNMGIKPETALWWDVQPASLPGTEYVRKGQAKGDKSQFSGYANTVKDNLLPEAWKGQTREKKKVGKTWEKISRWGCHRVKTVLWTGNVSLG